MWSLMEICLIDADRQLSGEYCLSVDAEFREKLDFLRLVTLSDLHMRLHDTVIIDHHDTVA
jgi:hypothetical protein